MTVSRKAEILSKNRQAQLRGLIQKAVSYSICLDESTDRKDIAQLVVWIRLVMQDHEVFDELLDLRPMLETTTSEDFIQQIFSFFEEYKISIDKITGVTTDGCPSTFGRKMV